MTAENLPTNVIQALSRIKAELPAFDKNKTAPANMGGYAYRGIEAITAAAEVIHLAGESTAGRCRCMSANQHDEWLALDTDLAARVLGVAAPLIAAAEREKARELIVVPVPVLEALASAWEDQAGREDQAGYALDVQNAALERCARMLREAITKGSAG